MDVPDEANDIAAELGWDRPVGAFHGLTAPLGFAFLMTLMAGLGVVISVLYVSSLYLNSRRGPLPGYAEGGIVAVAIAVLLLIVGVVMLTYYPPRRVFVYNEGVVYLAGRTKHVCPWAHISAVWQNTTAVFVAAIQTSRAGAITVTMNDGTTWSADSTTLKGASDLIPIIQEEVTRRLLPDYRRRFQAWESIPFGRQLQISRDGLATSRGFLPWTEIQYACLQAGYFCVQRRGAWISVWANVPVKKIPNVYVLDAILKGIPGIN
ncbi:MAG: hypothetical protein HY289_12910 [Planctomycetes bacterium]|nr:hypothetical protein [Planctomycetota bacterium]